MRQLEKKKTRLTGRKCPRGRKQQQKRERRAIVRGVGSELEAERERKP